ncbi:MAG: (2Fe-2S) ferredoxin domain-containing protein [Candidatus Borkfalkiaceae bacterium]|nr:(2Fe-2S) ferredoxin domain-containing protein [Christensenellaceae bacterium]
MVIIQVCVGSSCHLRGAPQVVELFQKKVADQNLEGEVVLMGSFCAGKCNKEGVTVTVNDDVFTGVTKDNFETFWVEKIKSLLA